MQAYCRKPGRILPDIFEPAHHRLRTQCERQGPLWSPLFNNDGAEDELGDSLMGGVFQRVSSPCQRPNHQ